MPRPVIVWSIEYDSLEAFSADAPATQARPASGAVAQQVSVAAEPSADQLSDARDKAQRMIEADAVPGADYTVTMDMDANGVMSVRVSRTA